MQKLEIVDKFHEDVYEFIFALFKSDTTRQKVNDVFIDMGNRFFDSKAAMDYHQNYEGGLADHTALVALDAFHSALTKPWLNVNTDDILVVALFHDVDKIGYKYNAPYGQSIVHGDRDLILYMEKYGLRSADTQDGLLLIHGGWVNDPQLKKVEHPPIAIAAHAADMFASHATKSEKDTRDRIRDVMKEILTLLSKESTETVDYEAITYTPRGFVDDSSMVSK